MTRAPDDRAVEDAFEAYLAGRPVPEEAAGLVAFAEATRSSASGPGRPSAALAELMANGLSREPEGRARRALRERAATLVTTIASARTVAQVAAAAGIVLVAFAGGGTAGVLPDPLQHGFAGVAASIGIEVEDPQQSADDDEPARATTAEPTGRADDPAATGGGATSPTPEDRAGTAEEWARNGPAEGQSFGDWVSEGERNGWADGAVISDWAHRKNVDWPPATATTTGTSPSPTAAPEGEDDPADDGPATTGTTGNGNTGNTGNAGNGSTANGGKGAAGSGNPGNGNAGNTGGGKGNGSTGSGAAPSSGNGGNGNASGNGHGNG